MTGLLDLKDFLDPGNDLMGRWVRGLVKVDDSVLLVEVKRTGHGGVAARKRSEMARLHVELFVVLSKLS